MTGWAEERLPDAAWRSPAGLTRLERAEEQDAAAGGRQPRTIRRLDGTASTASVALRVRPACRRCYAYLRWLEADGKTHERYLGEVARPTRAENLRAAWSLVRVGTSASS